MGSGFARRTSGQRSDLIGAAPRSADRGVVDSALRAVVLVLLAVDGILCAFASALLLPLYIGTVPFPISAFVAGGVNMALVWAAMPWTASNRLAALPLWTWLGTIGGLTFGGPGGDIIFEGPGISGYRVLLLIVIGAGPAVWLLWGRAQLSQAPAPRPR